MLDIIMSRRVITACYSALESAGFKRFAAKGLGLPLNSQFEMWLGLNEGGGESYIEINPYVGVHAFDIERLWTKLSDTKYRRTVATYSVHMGELRPHERSFVFSDNSNLELETQRLAELYKDVGLKFAYSINKYDVLEGILRENIGRLGGFPERYAVCLLLMNKKDQAREFVEKFAEEEPDYFSPFAKNFIDRL